MTDYILRLPTVKERTGLSRSSIYRYISLGIFPKSVPLGGHSVGWLSSEIDKWIEERVKARG